MISVIPGLGSTTCRRATFYEALNPFQVARLVRLERVSAANTNTFYYSHRPLPTELLFRLILFSTPHREYIHQLQSLPITYTTFEPDMHMHNTRTLAAVKSSDSKQAYICNAASYVSHLLSYAYNAI